MTILYNDGKDRSGVGGSQINAAYFERKALIEELDQMLFSQLADTKTMPKNQGKQIKQYMYVPVIDDRNKGGWGLDARGVRYENGNLYGSSKDVGYIADRFPVLGEQGGRVNKIDFTRIEIASNLHKFGMFYEYSADAERFDSDADLIEHCNREMMNASIKVYEDKLQIDLLTNAGTVKYMGSATQNSDLAEGMELSYAALIKLGIDLDKAQVPKHTEVITGTRMVDTKVLPATRVAYVGSELIPTLMAMKDYNGESAWVGLEKYAAGTTPLKGEVGSVGGFRFIVVPNMMKYSGQGATANDAAYYQTEGKYDVFPILVVGNKSFTTVGFQTDGKSQKFTTIHKKPSAETASRDEPYGEMGFSSIKWFYGFMVQKPEAIAVIKCVAKM
ncbi:N4-gp56 family major capsid protein [Moraxella atlantae]|uniref:N4-gp56 family major capsid protein n=1 Tax=Faucicola atlantae TaxID=34059 RepID=UPI0037535AFF